MANEVLKPNHWSLSLVTFGTSYDVLSLSPDSGKSANLSNYPSRKALVKHDYCAKDSTEMSVLTDEVITVRELPNINPDFLMGERGSQMGKVPKSVLELF